MENRPTAKVLTVGHSNKSWPDFERLLVNAGVDVLINVRSHPSSRFPHFSRPALRTALNAISVSYVYLGAELTRIIRLELADVA